MTTSKIRRVSQSWWASSALALLLMTVVQPVVYGGEQDRHPTSDDRDLLAGLDQVFSLIQANFVERVAPRILAEAATSGMLDAADPTGSLLGKDPFRKLLRQSSEVRNDKDWVKVVSATFVELRKKDYTKEALQQVAFGGMQRMIKAVDSDGGILPANYSPFSTPASGGIGVTIRVCDGIARVTSIADDGPASRAGVRPTDSITTVDGRSLTGLTAGNVIDLLRGPRGTDLRVGVRRSGSGEVADLEIVRNEIRTVSVRPASMIDAHTGYIGLNNFADGTDRDFGHAISDLAAKGMRRLVLDIRDNAGGPFDQAIRLAMRFLPRGDLIVSTRGRVRNSDSDYRATEANPWVELRLAILVNGVTAAGAEVLAAALQDNRRAVVVGTQTFGSRSVQSVYRVAGGSRISLTTSRWFRPKDTAVPSGGIAPDILADGPPCGELVIGSANDRQLQRALETFKEGR